jgi:hypothetical protein
VERFRKRRVGDGLEAAHRRTVDPPGHDEYMRLNPMRAARARDWRESLEGNILVPDLIPTEWTVEG